MSQMKRFNAIDVHFMYEDASGPYITWEDHAAENAQLQLQIARIRQETIEECIKEAQKHLAYDKNDELNWAFNNGLKAAVHAIRSLTQGAGQPQHLLVHQAEQQEQSVHQAGGKPERAAACQSHGSVPNILTVKHEVRQMLYQGYSIGVNHYGDPLLLKDGYTVAIIKETVEAMKELKAMRAAIRQIRDAISTDSCDGDSAYAEGVNAAVARHTEGIDTILREARIPINALPHGAKQNG